MILCSPTRLSDLFWKREKLIEGRGPFLLSFTIYFENGCLNLIMFKCGLPFEHSLTLTWNAEGGDVWCLGNQQNENQMVIENKGELLDAWIFMSNEYVSTFRQLFSAAQEVTFVVDLWSQLTTSWPRLTAMCLSEYSTWSPCASGKKSRSGKLFLCKLYAVINCKHG